MKTIFTLNGYFNYGNRLQLFALSKVLLKFNNGQICVYWPKDIKTAFKDFLKYYTLLRLKYRKEFKLRKFTKKYTPATCKNVDVGVSVIGSDQVWNPDYFVDKLYLLNGDKKTVNISYSASMGVEVLTMDQRKLFKEALENYKAISVREESARKLLQPLTDKKIEVVLDPTLLLNKTEYEKLEKKPKKMTKDEKYILCYILGNRDHQLMIEEFAKENNYRVILFSDKKGSNYGVEEFLYLIHHAELICTDSFHACVFSFIFDRPFVAFRRTGEADYMYSRLSNFIDMFKLKYREYNGFKINKENLRCDYSEGKRILEEEREKSLKFLDDALGDEEC